MFCTKCGTAIEDGKSVCPKCNASIGSAAPMNRVSETQSTMRGKESQATKKSGTSKFVKILGGLAVVVGIAVYIGIPAYNGLVAAYNGWVIWYNNGGGAVKATTEKLLTELIPQSLNKDVLEFVEVENFKIDSTAKHKWAGEVNAKVKVKESGKIGSLRFTFDVEEKMEDDQEMVYVQNLLRDEASAAKLLGEVTASQEVENTADTAKAEITDWVAYIVDLQGKIKNMTTLQREKLCKSEEGRYARGTFIVSNVRKASEFGKEQEVVEISGDCSDEGGAANCFSVFVVNSKNGAVAYKTALGLTKGMRVQAFGTVYFSPISMLLLSSEVPIVPSLAAYKLEIVEDGQ